MKRTLSWMIGLGLIVGTTYADGYLWLSAGGETPTPRLYRFNLRTAQIDHTLTPNFVTSGNLPTEYGYLAYDGQSLYIGANNRKAVARVNPYTGVVQQITAYNMCECFFGHHWMRDGAFKDGEFWRASPPHNPSQQFSVLMMADRHHIPELMRYAYTLNFATIGAEWVGEHLYLTTPRQFVRAEFDPDSDYTFTPVFYTLTGVPEGHTLGGLAYDADSGTLYLASRSATEVTIWALQVNDNTQTAQAEPVATLHDKGYPAGAYPASMGWVPAIPGDVDGNGCTDDSDLLSVLFAFGSNSAQQDLNRDGTVDDADLLIVLFNFGSGC